MNRRIFLSISLGLLTLLLACKQKAPARSTSTIFANETDFVCGMKVQASFTDTCHYKGKVYAFCSESCKMEFKADPETFLREAATHE